MKAFHTFDPAQFLNKVQPALEQDEAANQAMLFLCHRLIGLPAEAETAVMTWTEDAQGVTAAALQLPPGPLHLFCEPLVKTPSLRLLVNILRDVPCSRVIGKNHAVETYADIWKESFHGSASRAGQERVYKCQSVMDPKFVAGYMRLASSPDAEQLVEWSEMYQSEVRNTHPQPLDRAFILEGIEKGNFFVWEDGLMVSMIARSFSSRNGSSLDFLFTPPMLRGRGYAAALTGSICRQLFQEGNSFCSAVVDPLNQVAGHILHKLGFTIVCELTEIELRK